MVAVPATIELIPGAIGVATFIQS
jgi:hypothetical protein